MRPGVQTMQEAPVSRRGRAHRAGHVVRRATGKRSNNWAAEIVPSVASTVAPVNRSPIVGIDEIQIPQFTALIKVRHPGSGDFDQELREAVVDSQLGDARLERLKRLEKRILPARLENRVHESQNALLVLLVGTEPARVHFRLAQRFDHALPYPFPERGDVLVEWP